MTSAAFPIRKLVVAFVSVVAVVGVYQVSPIGAAGPSLHCDQGSGEYGEYGDWVKCAGGGQDAVALRWPDGVVTTMQHTRAPVFVGDGAVELLSNSGGVLASVPVRIEPDIGIECETHEGELKKIFELVTTDLRETGWDYAFTNIETGERVLPGDPGHPNGGDETGYERIILDETQSTRACRLISAAGEDLDGEYQLTIVSPWEEPQTTPMRLIGPASRTRWAGTQPAQLTGTVTINNVTASERVDVYQSGCS